jgi:kinesin family protein 3/17
MSESIKVAVRCRPLNSKEIKAGMKKTVKIDTSRNEIHLTSFTKNKKKQFTFDYTYDESSEQKKIYQMCAFRIVESVLEGYNGTIFAYGQTGTGKTYTMEGIRDSEENKGIIPRTFEQIFGTIGGTVDKQFLVSISMLELYKEDIYDLLIPGKKNKLDLREKPGEGFFVKNLSMKDIKSAKECLDVLNQGSKNRTQDSTEMNEGNQISRFNQKYLQDLIVFSLLQLKLVKRMKMEMISSEKEN